MLDRLYMPVSHMLAGIEATTSAALYFEKMPNFLQTFHLADHLTRFAGSVSDSVLMSVFAVLCLTVIPSRWRTFQKQIYFIFLESAQNETVPTIYDRVIKYLGVLAALAKALASVVSVQRLLCFDSRFIVTSRALACVAGSCTFAGMFSVLGVNQNKRKPLFFDERVGRLSDMEGDVEAGSVVGLVVS